MSELIDLNCIDAGIFQNLFEFELNSLFINWIWRFIIRLWYIPSLVFHKTKRKTYGDITIESFDAIGMLKKLD